MNCREFKEFAAVKAEPVLAIPVTLLRQLYAKLSGKKPESRRRFRSYLRFIFDLWFAKRVSFFHLFFSVIWESLSCLRAR